MNQVPDQNAWEREQQVVNAARVAEPAKFVGSEKPPHALFEFIGIKNPPKDLPKGYFKYRPEDFIVEEVRPDGTVITVDGQPAKADIEGGEGTVYFDLTKVGTSTLDAGNKIAELTGYDGKSIGYAGIKDAVALTAQRMSIRGGIVNEVLLLDLPGMIVRNVQAAKGVIQIGQLQGNRFTLMLRTEHPLPETWVEERMNEIKTRGIMNYFGVQRFGTPRFLAHEVGKAMLIQGAQAGVKAYMTTQSPFELPYFTDRRVRLLDLWGNWKAMQEAIQDLPYTFRHEHDMLTSLIKTGGEFRAAMEAVQQQAGMWVRAYASYAANELLSDAEAQQTELPDSLPQFLNPDPKSLTVYKATLERDGLKNPMQALKSYPYIRVGRNPTFIPRIHPDIHAYRCLPEGLAITFSLPKGAYATTMLMYLIDSVTGYPVPEWVDTKFIDAKEALGTGSLKVIKEKLDDVIERMMARKNEDAEGGDD